MKSTSIKNTRLFRLYDIQHDYKVHKEKINNIKRKKSKQIVHNSFHNQINLANSLKKNWMTAQVQRSHQKQRQIVQQNLFLYKRILETRNRIPLIKLNRSQPHITMRSSQSLNNENSLKQIKKQNQKLMEKILTAKSPLNKNAMKLQYKKIKQTKKRLETFSSSNKRNMISTLRKMNLHPNVYFPKVKLSIQKIEKIVI